MRVRLVFPIIFAVMLCLVGLEAESGGAQSAGGLDLVRPSDPSEQIAGLRWLPNVEVFRGNVGQLFAKVRGEYFRKDDTTLFWGDIRVRLDNGGKFALLVPLEGLSTSVQMLAFGAFGRRDYESIELNFPVGSSMEELFQNASTSSPQEGKNEAEEVTESQEPKFWSFSFGGGATHMTYQQTGRSTLTQLASTVKASFGYIFAPPSWDIGFNAFYNPAVIAKDSSGATIQSLGVNGRIGYAVPFVGEPWRLSFMTGWYFATMSVKGGTFGYKNLVGPQAFITLRRAFPKSGAIFTYFKLAPVSETGLSVSMTNREIATGGGWAIPLGSAKIISLSLDWATLNFSMGRTTIKSNTLSFGAALGL